MAGILLYPLSIVPVILIYIWIKKKIISDDEHIEICRQALFNGAKALGPVLLLGALFSIIELILKFADVSRIFMIFYHNFFVLALAEELSKAYMLKRLFTKYPIGYSWLDIMVFLQIIAIGFDILESLLYSIGASVPIVIVRGLTFPHLGYGLLMGYWGGKAVRCRNRLYYIPAIVLPWLIHGMYDFCLSPEILDLYESIALFAVLIAFLDIVLVIIMVIFVLKARKKAKYTEIILEAGFIYKNT